MSGAQPQTPAALVFGIGLESGERALEPALDGLQLGAVGQATAKTHGLQPLLEIAPL